MKKYIYLALILSASIILSILLIDIYKNNFIKEEENIFLDKPYYQIKVSELKSYLTENSEFIIYVNNLKSSEEFQKEFADYIIEKDLGNGIIFVDGRNIDESDLKYLKSIYNGSLNFTTINFENDNLLKVSDRHITDYLALDEKSNVELINTYLAKNKALND